MADKVVGIKIVVKGTDETIKKLAGVEMELEGIASQLKEAKKGGDADAYARLRQEQERLKKSASDLKKEIREQQKAFEATEGATGSYRQLNAQLVTLRNTFKNLSQAEREGAVGKAVLGDIQKLDGQLKKIDASLGNFQRNVGNYAGGLRGLFKQLQGTLTSTALFGRISNLPGLFNTAKDAILKMAEGITFLNELFDSNAGLQRMISENTDKVIESFIEERSQVDGLIAAAEDKNATDEERAAAISELNDLYRTYLPNLGTEKLDLQEIKDLQDEVNSKIIEGIAVRQKAEVAKQLLAEISKKDLELQKQEIANAVATDPLAILANKAITATIQQEKAIAESQLKNINVVDARFRQILQGLSDSGLDFASAFAGDPGKVKDSAEKARQESEKAAEKAKQQNEKAQKALLDAQQKFEQQRNEIQQQSFKEIERQRIESISNLAEKERQEELSRLEDFKKAQKDRLTQLDESAKTETEKVVENFGKQSKQALEIENKFSQERIRLEADTQVIIQKEIELSNQKIAEINKKFAEQQASARAEIQAEALKAALGRQESALGAAEGAKQQIQLQFDFEASQSRQAFDQAKAELELQLSRGLISQQEFAAQVSDLQVKQLESENELLQRRINAEQQANAQILAQTQSLNNAKLESTIIEIEAEKQARLKSIDEQAAQGLITQQEAESARAQAAKSTDERILDEKQAVAQQNAILQQQFNNDQLAATQQLANQEVQIEKSKVEQINEIRKNEIAQFQQGLQLFSDAFNQFSTIFEQSESQRLQQSLLNVEDRYRRETDLAFGNAEKIKAIEERKAKAIDKINRQNSERQKAIAITQAIINGALAITNIQANMVDPTPVQAFKAIATAITVATVAAQIATIAAQKFAHGGELGIIGGDGEGSHVSDGFISGPSHYGGGVKILTSSGLAEVEGGEFIDATETGSSVVINKKSAQAFKSKLKAMQGVNFVGKREILSQINSFAGWGKRFGSGGEFNIVKPLSAPVVGSAISDVQTVSELQKQNALLQQSNSFLQQNFAAMQNLIVNLKVTADPGEITKLGIEQMEKTKKTQLG